MADFQIEQLNPSQEQAIAAAKEKWRNKSLAGVLRCMLSNKTRYGARVAAAFQTIDDAAQESAKKNC